MTHLQIGIIPSWVLNNVIDAAMWMKANNHDVWMIAGVRSEAAHLKELKQLREANTAMFSENANLLARALAAEAALIKPRIDEPMEHPPETKKIIDEITFYPAQAVWHPLLDPAKDFKDQK